MVWKKIIRYPFLWLMTAIIFVCSFCFIVKKEVEFSELENRSLGKMPHLTIETLMDSTFMLDYETYVNEQFPWRNEWITLKADMEQLQGKKENNGIIKGKNGRLFQKKMDIGTQAKKNIALVQQFQERLANENQKSSKKTNLTVSIIPNSYGILLDDLPKGLPNINQQEYLEQYESELKKEHSIKKSSNTALSSSEKQVGEQTYLNLIPILEEHKDEDIYYNTDHHWTVLGAYYAYKEFCLTKNLEAVSLDSLEEKQVEHFFGTYYSKYRGSQIKGDIFKYYEIPIAQMSVDGKMKETLYDKEKLETRDKYAMFLYGNHALTVIESKNVKEKGIGKKILLIKDSYANSMIPYLTYNYETVYAIDLRYYNDNIIELLQKEGIEDCWLIYNFDTFVEDNHFYRLQKGK